MRRGGTGRRLVSLDYVVLYVRGWNTNAALAQNFPKARERLEDLRKGGARKQHSRVSRSAMKKQSDGDCTVM